MNIITGTLEQIFGGINQFTNDYGVTIILITLCIRILLLPLSLKQKESMKKQQVLNEKINDLKVRYKNNEKKLNAATAELMQKEGTGMGGCLLSLLQLPIMFALNGVIRTAITGTAVTVLLPWIPSLLARDPFFILPVLSVLIHLLPQVFPYIRFFKELNLPKTGGQSAVMIIVMNLFIGFSLPAGIGLYYCVSGIFYAGEQFILHVVSVIRQEKIRPQHS